jgi:hypothetical protein
VALQLSDGWQPKQGKRAGPMSILSGLSCLCLAQTTDEFRELSALRGFSIIRFNLTKAFKAYSFFNKS